MNIGLVEHERTLSELVDIGIRLHLAKLPTSDTVSKLENSISIAHEQSTIVYESRLITGL